MRRAVIAAVALVAIGCSSHSGMAPAPTRVRPEVNQKHISKHGWIYTPLKQVSGRGWFADYLTVDNNQNVWAAIQDRDLTGGGIEKIAMDQTVTSFNLSIQPYSIVQGPDGNLWLTGYQGNSDLTGVISRVTPTGVETDFTTIANTDFSNIVSGPDGALWFSECLWPRTSGGVGRIDVFGNYTFFPTGCVFVVTIGPDGNIWSSGTDIDVMTTQGIPVAHYPVGFGTTDGMATGSDGAIYTSGETPNGSPEFVRVTTGGIVSILGLPGDGNVILGEVIHGPDGNLWLGADNTQNGKTLLYEFDLSTQLWRQGIPTPMKTYWKVLALGPDNNLWMSRFRTTAGPPGLSAYIYEALALTPSTVTVGVGTSANINVSETNYAGQWTAISTNPSIATVTPDSQGDAFTITGIAPGTTKIVVSDSMFNSVEANVTVTP